MGYTRVDLANWDRRDLFTYYIQELRIVVSLTADIDVAPLIAYTKRMGLKFYPSMIWAVSTIINRRKEFRYGWDEEGNLILWDRLDPSYTVFHPQEEQFTKQMTDYREDLADFHRAFLEDGERYRHLRGIAPLRRRNAFDVSCLPWINYRHIDTHVFDDGRHLGPVITWGRFETQGARAMLPLSINIHHAVADGFHISRFFREVQELIDSMQNDEITP